MRPLHTALLPSRNCARPHRIRTFFSRKSAPAWNAAREVLQVRYRSTSKQAPLTSLRGAALRGLAPDGGLYMPAETARRLPFTEVCFRIVKPFVGPEVPEEILWQVVSEAINFPVKLISLSPALHVL